MASKGAQRINALARVRALQVLRKEFWLEYMVNTVAYRQAGYPGNARNPAIALVADTHPERYRELYLQLKTELSRSV